jgi:hypothetical protein
MGDWPFDDREDVATFTVREVIRGEKPILLVAHDADDGMWQFLTGEPVEMADAMLVSLREVYRIDPTIGELADLPPGWTAERAAIGQPWHRQPASGD